MLGDLLKKTEISRHGRLYIALIRLISIVHPAIWISEKDLSDFPLTSINRRTKVLLGYFQRFVYVDAVSQEIIDAMSKSTIFKAIFSSPQQNSIAVHIRFGDYLTNKETKRFHGLSAMSYYVEAVKRLQATHHYDKIMIFSDDRQRAIAEFTNEYGLEDLRVSASHGENEYEDLAEISSCKGIVISNSTFSWWAGWIGTQLHECNVVAPRPWFATPSAADDNLLPGGWTVLNRELQS